MVVVVLASGPSLTAEDIEQTEGMKTIAVNQTIFTAPHAEYCYAYDDKWWIEYGEEVKKLKCNRVTCSIKAHTLGAERLPKASGKFDGSFAVGSSSGAHAICLAVMLGATKVILLGFDCQHTEGKRHHHEDYPDGFGNADRPERWIKEHEKIAQGAKNLGVRIINCTRHTALECYEKQALSEALNGC